MNREHLKATGEQPRPKKQKKIHKKLNRPAFSNSSHGTNHKRRRLMEESNETESAHRSQHGRTLVNAPVNPECPDYLKAKYGESLFLVGASGRYKLEG